MTTKARLALPNPCPSSGVWLAPDQFFYQPPQIFAKLGLSWKLDPASALAKLSSPQVGNDPFGVFEFFADAHPICVEFCSGNGDWITQKAQQSPKCNWIAVEQRLDRARKIWQRKQRATLSNLAIACTEAELFCARFLPTSSVEQCFVNFPDPWPKERHAKHRLLKPRFLDDVWRALVPSGHLFVATDDAKLMRQLECDIALASHFLFQRSHLQSDSANFGASYFSALWKSKGRELHLAHCRALSKPYVGHGLAPISCEPIRQLAKHH